MLCSGGEGGGWALQPVEHSSIGAFSVAWAVEKLLLIAAQGKGTWCLLECFVGIVPVFSKAAL